MSEFNSSSAPPPQSSSNTASLASMPKNPAMSEVEKFRNAIQKQTLKSAVSSNDSQEQGVSSTTNNQPQSAIPYNLNHQATAKFFEYEKERNRKDEKDEKKENKKRGENGKQKNNKRKINHEVNGNLDSNDNNLIDDDYADMSEEQRESLEKIRIRRRLRL